MSTNDPERWLEEHGSALYSFALLHLRDPQRAEDAVQETLLAALQARERYAGNASVRTWLTGILKHKIIDEFRRQSREAPASDSTLGREIGPEDCAFDESFTGEGRWNRPLADWGDPEGAFSREQFWALVQRCISALSPRMARLFILRELWEMETAEVCKELDITPTNLWTTLHRARLSMRQCLEGFVQS
jgi:RNA polymerase sigma-70 factor (ECF subfamily)